MNKIMSIEEMKQFAKKIDKEEERELIDIFNNKIDNINFGAIKNYNETQKKYEVYIYIEYEEGVISPLLINYYTNKLEAQMYYNHLASIISKKDKDKIMKKISLMLLRG